MSWQRLERFLFTAAVATAFGLSSCGDSEGDSGGANNNNNTASAVCSTGCADRENQGPFPDCDCLGTCETGYAFNSAESVCDSCTANPNACAVNEIVDQDNECACTNTCNTGFTYNASTGMCDPEGRCTQATDCPGANPACIVSRTTEGLEPCAGQDTCECTQLCDWGVPDDQAGCMNEDFCAIDYVDLMGYCIPASQNVGGGQVEACTASFDGAGNYIDDTCQQNFICGAAQPQDPTSICLRSCRSARDTLCATLGPFTCQLDVEGVGLCFFVECNIGAAGDAACNAQFAGTTCIDGFCR